MLPGSPRTRSLAAVAAALLALCLAPSVAGAAGWIAPETLPGLADSAAGADVAAGPDGTLVAAWTRATNGKPQVVASVRPPGGAFSSPEAISQPNATSPRVVVDGRGTTTVVWQQISNVSSLFKVQESTRAAGGSFGAPVDLSSESDESKFPAVAVDAAGTTLVAWQRVKVGAGNRPVIEAAARPAAAADFGAKAQVSEPGATQSMVDPRVTVGEDGTGMVVWTRDPGRGESSRWTAGGGFAPSQPIGASDDFVSSPDVAIDRQGTAVFAYFGIEAGARGIRTQTRTAGGAASSTAQVAPLTGTSGSSPELLADRSGAILLTWDEHPATAGNPTLIRAADRPAGQGFQGVTTLSGALGFNAPRAETLSSSGDTVVAWVAPGERVQARVRRRGAGSFDALQNDFPVRTDVTDPATFADGEGNLGVLWRRAGAGDPGAIEVRAFDAAPPAPRGIAGPQDAVAGRPATLSAAFRDTWSGFSVGWAFGDGASAAGASTVHAYPSAGGFTATATATDAEGNAASQSAPIGVRNLRPDEIDADRDGFSAAEDCDDADAAIRPGALEIPGNGTDENCDRRVDPFPRQAVTASIAGFFGKRFTLMVGLRVTGLEGGETVKLSCKGGGCRKTLRTTIAIRRKRALLTLDKRVKGARLRTGTRLQVRVERPGFVTKTIRFTIRPNLPSKRAELCQPPGGGRTRAC